MSRELKIHKFPFLCKACCLCSTCLNTVWVKQNYRNTEPQDGLAWKRC